MGWRRARTHVESVDLSEGIQGSAEYDQQFTEAIGSGLGVEASYWELVTSDISAALDILRRCTTRAKGSTGTYRWRSIPALPVTRRAPRHRPRARRTARRTEPLHQDPGNGRGLAPIQQMISEKRSINVTLIFSLERYAAVMEAYLAGLEAAPGDLSDISSVASFFISRVDVEIDRRLDEIGTEEALALKGKAAVANGKLAYELFRQTFSGPRWEALVERGARVQRPLWASTSTKNPDYPDTLYVDELIGPDTVNTLPDNTLEAFEHHGTVARTVDEGVQEAHAVIEALAGLGIHMDEVTQKLEDEGVAAFEKSFDELLAALGEKATGLT